MENLEIYKKLSQTPAEARKDIQAGRLKGMTDINPMWRIKKLTEVFGMCGIGWKYVITNKQLETGCKGQISAFVDVDLFIKVDGQWSEAIPGTGGASFVTDEKNGLYQSDECFKMALTDAIGICCKALGMSSDIYFSKDRTKYNTQNDENVSEFNESCKKLNECNTLEELQTVYMSLSIENRKLTLNLKDQLKQKLNGNGKD